MMHYRRREEVRMTLERYEGMKEEIERLQSTLEEINTTFFTLVDKGTHEKALIHLDEIKKWVKENLGTAIKVNPSVFDGTPIEDMKIYKITEFECVGGGKDDSKRT